MAPTHPPRTIRLRYAIDKRPTSTKYWESSCIVDRLEEGHHRLPWMRSFLIRFHSKWSGSGQKYCVKDTIDLDTTNSG
jgi:hypothetical protein